MMDGLCKLYDKFGRIHIIWLSFFILHFLLGTAVLRAEENRYAASSAMSTGKWVKVRVDQTGIYKLTYVELKKMGFADPSKVSVHGYGGWPLEEDFSQPYIDDVPATAVWRGESFLLFYARGPIKWAYNRSNNTFEHTNNPYATYGCYFITDATDTKEMQTAAKGQGATLQVKSFDDYLLHEKELVSVNYSGRELYGESFETNLSQDFSFSMPGITQADGKATLRFIAKAKTGETTVKLSVDGQQVIQARMSSSSANDSYTKANVIKQVGYWSGEKSEKFKVNVLYGTTGHENVRLDYIRMQAQRTLKPYGAYTFFRSIASIGNSSRFVIEGADTHSVVFDVTDPVNPKRI